jgi:hypothetical protein
MHRAASKEAVLARDDEWSFLWRFDDERKNLLWLKRFLLVSIR